MTLVFSWILAFGSALALDFADAQNKLAIQARDAHRAARWSVVMYLVGLAAFYAVLEVSPLLAIPTSAGLYAGSLVALRKHA